MLSQIANNNPEPDLVLALTSLCYMYPMILSFEKQEYYLCMTFMLLTVTSVLYHSTHFEFFLILDLIAVGNYFVYGLVCMPYMPLNELVVCLFPYCYITISFFVGKRLQIFCFDPNRNIQVISHGLIHLFSCYSPIFYLRNRH
jgi:hypothetical protein